MPRKPSGKPSKPDDAAAEETAEDILGPKSMTLQVDEHLQSSGRSTIYRTIEAPVEPDPRVAGHGAIPSHLFGLPIFKGVRLRVTAEIIGVDPKEKPRRVLNDKPAGRPDKEANERSIAHYNWAVAMRRNILKHLNRPRPSHIDAMVLGLQKLTPYADGNIGFNIAAEMLLIAVKNLPDPVAVELRDLGWGRTLSVGEVSHWGFPCR